MLVMVDDVIELGGAYLWAAVITTENNNVVSCHFGAFMGLNLVKRKIDVGLEMPHAS